MIKILKGTTKDKNKMGRMGKKQEKKRERKRVKKGLMEGVFIMERAYPEKETKNLKISYRVFY